MIQQCSIITEETASETIVDFEGARTICARKISLSSLISGDNCELELKVKDFFKPLAIEQSHPDCKKNPKGQ